jgi:hypothetical protein
MIFLKFERFLAAGGLLLAQVHPGTNDLAARAAAGIRAGLREVLLRRGHRAPGPSPPVPIPNGVQITRTIASLDPMLRAIL